VAESFFATLKIELAYQTRWSTRAQARSEIFEYIEIFNNQAAVIPPSAIFAPMNSNDVNRRQ
jgi:hypothetical protein